jgi:quercetin dioxygenase-like cupin family protein
VFVAVKHVRIDRALADPSLSPIFLGEVLTQNLVAEGEATLLRVTAVTFEDGARNRWHRHTTDQVLVVTAGRGIVATDFEEYRVGIGDVVLVPAGERHWYGAEPGESFTHLSILTPGEMTIEDELIGATSGFVSPFGR